MTARARQLLLRALDGLEDAEMLIREAARAYRERDPDAEVIEDAKLAVYRLLGRHGEPGADGDDCPCWSGADYCPACVAEMAS